MKNFNELREIISEDYFTVQYYNGNGSVVDDKFKNFKSKAEADKYAKKGNKIDSVGGEYKTFKVKGRMESVELDEYGLAKGRGFPGIKADNTVDKTTGKKKKKKNKRVLGQNKNIAYNYDKDKRKESVDVDNSEDTLEENLKGIAKALTSMAGKPEYKKVARNLKSLAMRAGEGDKKAAKQISTQLDKLIMKVDKKSAAKLMKLADLTLTYEEVEEGLVKGRGFPGIKADKKKKKNKRVHGANKNIAYDYDRDKRKEDVEEAVSVDMRTRGFKSAVKRNLLRKEKAVSKKKSEIDEIIDATNKKLRGESMVASGSDATGDVAGKDIPLLKKKKVLKKFKDA